MLLKSLELTGFKSFAKASELHFSSAITAIVGPNGSGKSNVAESFRFVLGEQSMKSMRGKRGEDLIFNGSQEAARANRAGVKLVFDNSSRFLNIDFPEVSIERVVHRDGVNEYFINGSQVRLKDVLELLSGAHVGASGHHIISQGEADRILNANSKERKAMLEDALGLKVYQYKKEESQRKLQKTDENIKQVESLRREIAPHIKFLKKQVERVEKAMAMKEELRELYKDYLKREETYIRWHKENIRKQKEPLEEELKRLHKKLAEAKSILEKNSGADADSKEILALQGDIEKARENKDTVMRELGRLEGEVASLERAIKKYSESSAHIMVPFSEVRELSVDALGVLKDLSGEGDLSKIKEGLDRIKALLSGFVARHESGEENAMVKEAAADLEKLTVQREGLEEKLKEAEAAERELRDKYEALKQKIDEAKDESREAEKEVFRIMSEEQEAVSKINILKARAEKVRVEEEDLKREMSEGGVLVGRAVLEFSTHTVMNGGSKAATDEEVASEPRGEQEARRRAIEKIKIRLEDAGLGAGEDVMKEYKETTERDEFLARELEDLFKSSESLNNLIKELEEKLASEFQAGVEKINKQFQEFFSLMFGGGSAKLSVVREKKKKRKISITDLDGPASAEGYGEAMEDEDEPAEDEGEEIEEGIEIDVSLPRKKTKGLMMLSGGERALTSIALLFAISQVNPPPFVILDETDAALDEANSKKYGDMVESLAKHSQLILITHNRETMSRAGVLYGVTMGSGGISKLLSVAFDEAVAVAK